MHQCSNMQLRITGTHIKSVMFAFSKLIYTWGIYRPQEKHIQLLLAICVRIQNWFLTTW
jgi:hypothetical protein